MSTEMHIPQHWRLNSQRYAMEGLEDGDAQVSFPPAPDKTFTGVPVQRRTHSENYVFGDDVETGAAALFEALVQSAEQPVGEKVLEMETV